MSASSVVCASLPATPTDDCGADGPTALGISVATSGNPVVDRVDQPVRLPDRRRQVVDQRIEHRLTYVVGEHSVDRGVAGEFWVAGKERAERRHDQPPESVVRLYGSRSPAGTAR
ncbi:MAG: hypothetical protein ABWY20_13260 [Mycobacterium sp.]